jgi:serine phosphatase RsbU (regulator of sigma subunit)
MLMKKDMDFPPVDIEVLREELVAREAELALINSVQQALASHHDVKAIYNLVGDKIRDIFNSQVVMISTYDQATETIEHRYAIERGEHIYAPGRYPIRGFRTQIVQTRQPVLVNTDVAEQAAKIGQHTIPGTITPKSWLGVPMIVGDQVTGILSLQNVDQENAFDEADVHMLQTLASSMSVALENARLFDETQRLLKETEERATELHTINSVQEALAQRLDRASIYEQVGAKIYEFFKPADVAIVIYDQETDFLSSQFQVENGARLPISAYSVGGKGFFGYLLKKPQLLLIDEHMDEALIQYQNVYSSGEELPKSIIYVPLLLGEVVQGAIVVKDKKKEHAFDSAGIRLLKTLANATSVALENARLWEQEALYRKALEREFEIGKEIQAGFLPDSIPQPEGWEIAASLKSAREVTGDFYDVFEVADGMIGLVIADVCDKGLGAALFMTLFRSLIRAASNVDFFSHSEYAAEITPEERIEHAISFTNNYFAETHGKTSMFCTLFFGILDTRTGKLRYVNGGHLPPAVVRQGQVINTLMLTGPAVGLVTQTDFNVGEATLLPGDLLFAQTDGLADAINPQGDYLNLTDLLPNFDTGEHLEVVLERIQDQIREFTLESIQADDITLLAVRRKI